MTIFQYNAERQRIMRQMEENLREARDQRERTRAHADAGQKLKDLDREYDRAVFGAS